MRREALAFWALLWWLDPAMTGGPAGERGSRLLVLPGCEGVAGDGNGVRLRCRRGGLMVRTEAASPVRESHLRQHPAVASWGEKEARKRGPPKPLLRPWTLFSGGSSFPPPLL